MATASISMSTSVKMSATEYCSFRNQPDEAHQIIQEHKSVGLSDDAALQQYLANGEYVEVLQHIWAERNRNCRLDWLRSNAANLYAPLMYELAISEFVMNPTVETVNLVSLPLLAAASFRVRQDVQCFTTWNTKSASVDEQMELVYRTSLDTQIQKHLQTSLASILETNIEERNQAVNQKVVQTAKKSMEINLPNPDWAGKGLRSFFGTVKIAVPEKQKEITDQYAQAIIEKTAQ